MKTRIFYITRARLSFSRAHARNVLKTAEYLQARGDIEIVVFSSAPEKKKSADILMDKGVKTRFILDIASFRRSMLYALWEKRRTFDVLYFRDPYIWYAAIIARIFLRKKVIFEAHGSYEWRWGMPFWRLALASAEGVVYITQALKSFYRLSKPGVIAHCNGINPADFSSAKDLPALFPTLHGMTVIMYAGSFMWDDHAVLLEVIARLPEEAALVLVGVKEGNIPSIFAQVKKVQLEKRVFFIRRVSPMEVPAYLLAADILVNTVKVTYPSSISSKLYEYLAAGKPIVSSPGGANREILQDGVNALVVDALTPESFAEAINKLLRDPDFARRLAANAKKDSLQYTWEKRAEAIASLIKELHVSS